MRFIKYLPNWLRWILILPVSTIFYISLLICFDRLHTFSTGIFLDVSPQFIMGFFQFIANNIASYYFVWIGGTLTPKYNLNVATVLTVLMIIVNIFFFTTSQLHNSYTFYQEIWAIACRLSAIIVMIYTCNTFKVKIKK